MNTSDENIVRIGAELFCSAKVLFQPIHPRSPRHFFSRTSRSVTLTSAKMCTIVVLSGGTTILQRMVERITNVLAALATSTMRPRCLLRVGLNWCLSLSCLLAPRRKHHHCRRCTVPLRGIVVTAKFSLVKEPVESTTLLFRAT